MPTGRMVRTAPGRGQKRGMNPDRLTKFLDNPALTAMESFAGNSTRGGSVKRCGDGCNSDGGGGGGENTKAAGRRNTKTTTQWNAHHT